VVIHFLRFVGLLNAAVWLGSAIFFALGVAPGIFSQDMQTVLGDKNYPYFSGKIAQIVIARYFYFQTVCGIIALLHLLAERLYLGRPARALALGLVTAMIAAGLLGGVWLQPKMKELHEIKYHGATPALREAAANSFRQWHAASQVVNLLMLFGLAAYLWRAAHPIDPTRFLSASTPKFRT
jgi:hypothetical protein